MRANPYAVTNRSGGRSGWSGSALMVPGGISDGLAKLGQALVEAPLARRRIEQQAAVQKAQQDRQGRQDSLAEALGVSRMDESKARVAQMQDDSSRKWAEDTGRGALNALGVLGIGPNAKGSSTAAKDPDRPMTRMEAARAALAQAKAEVGPHDPITGTGGQVDPRRVDALTKQFMAGGRDDEDEDAPQTVAQKALGAALAGTPAVVQPGVEVPPAGTSSAGPASPLGQALSAAPPTPAPTYSWSGVQEPPAIGDTSSPAGQFASLRAALTANQPKVPQGTAPAAIMAPAAPEAPPMALGQALGGSVAAPAAPVVQAPAAGGPAIPRSVVAAKIAAGAFPDVASAEADLKGRGYTIDESR